MLHLMIPKLLFTTLTIKTELYCIRVILYKRYSIKQKEAVIEKTNKQTKNCSHDIHVGENVVWG